MKTSHIGWAVVATLFAVPAAADTFYVAPGGSDSSGDGSAAVDAADGSDMPADDIRGLARDGAPDLGAYERGATVAAGGGGASSSGSGGHSSASGNGGGAGSASAGAPSTEDSGCGCQLPRAAPPGSGELMLLWLVAAGSARRRTRGPRRPARGAR